MWKIISALILIGHTFGAEISAPYATIKENTPHKIDLRSDKFYPEGKALDEKEVTQPAVSSSGEQPVFNSNEQEQQPGYVYPPPPPPPAQPVVETVYIPEGYAPAYNGYDPSFAQPGTYGYAPAPYYPAEPEPAPSPLSLLWSTVPDARTIVNAVGRSAAWLVSSATVLAFGALLVIAACSFTQICSISYNGYGFGPIREEMRSFMTPEKLGNAADFVKSAIDKYQKIQKIYKNSKQK